MMEKLFSIIKEHGAELFAPIPLADCKVIRPYKLKQVGFDSFDGLNVIMLAIPYLTRHTRRNVSSYAAPYDYHGYFSRLFASLIPHLESEFKGKRFAGFADDSPIDERLAAAQAALGILGDNGMLITEKYSSYVFLGEIVTDLSLDCQAHPIEKCRGCGVCKRACPMEEIGQCLSLLTQKKGELSPTEAEFIKKYGSAWGCDRCQESCPHTLRAIKNGTIYTDIDYFKENPLPCLSTSDIASMTDEEFARRAYSWRKRETILRNLAILEEEK